jgi:hypothetical protein
VNQSERLRNAAVSSVADYETGRTRVNADIARAVPSGRRADDRLCGLRRVGAPVSQATIDSTAPPKWIGTTTEERVMALSQRQRAEAAITFGVPILALLAYLAFYVFGS